jgi:hypothetical protein
MSAAASDTPGVTYHGSNLQYFQLRVDSNSQGGYDVSAVGLSDSTTTTQNDILIHGWLLWASWGIFGLLQFVSARYLKKYWRVNMWIHRIGGTFIVCCTIALGIVGIKRLGWTLSGEKPHHVIGLIIFFSVIFVAVGGVFARSRARRLIWKSKVVQRVQFIHKVREI